MTAKTNKPRKPRTDSAAAAVAAAVAAAQPLPECPSYIRLRERDQPFWEAILRARAHAEWTPDQLVIAAQLARCQADIERESEELEHEGAVIEKEGKYGMVPFANPRHMVLEQLARKQMMLMRSMGMTGAVANGSKPELQKQRGLERAAREQHEQIKTEEELLA